MSDFPVARLVASILGAGLTVACARPAAVPPTDPHDVELTPEERREREANARRYTEKMLAQYVRHGGVKSAPDVPPTDASARIGSFSTVPTGAAKFCDRRAGENAPTAFNPDPMMSVGRGDGIEVSTGLPKIEPSTQPPWDTKRALDEACAYAGAEPGAAAYLLAWNVVEDDRPLRNMHALVAVAHRVRSGVEPMWTGVVMYRHATNDWWNINYNPFHSPHRPIRHYRRALSASALYALLEENDWQFAAHHEGFRMLAGGFVDEAWHVVIGELPTRRMAAPREPLLPPRPR